jgi:hypothetical protein
LTSIWRTNTPRFFSSRTRPDTPRPRNASAIPPGSDAQHVGNRRFVELGAGGEIAGDDHPFELALDERRQRIRLQDANRMRAAADL